MHRTVSSLFAVVVLAIAAAPAQSLAANLTTLVSFCALANCADGVHPEARLVADDDGNLFGATVLGGVNGQGTVFEIVNTAGGRGQDGGRQNLHRPGVPDYAGTPTTLVSFCALANCADGALPNGLIGDVKGNLFGTTSIGGSTNGQGTVFEIAKTVSGYAGSPTTLVSFCALANCADGANPTGGLIADAKGNLFGTTGNGGANVAPGAFGGTVFEIVNNAQGRGHEADRRNHRHPGPDYASTATPLASFCALANCADGALPRGGLIADADGNLFGTTYTGGASDGGTVFEIVKTASGYASTVSTLVSFCALANCADGATPNAGLIADAKGNLFGTTFGGGANGRGTVFEIFKTASGYASSPTILASFCALPNCADGAGPQADLIADAKGNLFGTTSAGGAGNNGGTVFEIVNNARGHAADRRNHHPGLPDYASTPTTLVSFCTMANCADGAEPLAGLIADARGNLFGTTFGGGTGTGNTGGAVSGGTVFEITDSGFVVAHKFDGAPGQPNCFGQSVSALATKFGGLNGAADDLGHPSVRALQDAILEFCEG
jgi:uncharacterized repeat protein (TIGR03803 family)